MATSGVADLALPGTRTPAVYRPIAKLSQVMT